MKKNLKDVLNYSGGRRPEPPPGDNDASGRAIIALLIMGSAVVASLVILAR